MRFMNLLNPFSSDSSQPPPPLPRPLPLQSETQYPSKFIQNSDPLPAATTYNGPPPVDYEKPPLPPSSNGHSGYPSIKPRSCNSCNKVPWLPMQLAYSGDASYASSSQSLESSPNDEYLSQGTHEVPYHADAYHAASQEIRVPDYSFNAPLPSGKPVPDPLHMYPGAMPPLFNAEDFNSSVQIIPNTLPSSISGNGVSTGNGSFLKAKSSSNGGHNEQSVYPGPSGAGVVSQEPEYINPSSHQPSGVFNNGGHYDVTGLNGSPGGFINNASQTNQNIPSNYGNSGPDRESYYNHHKNYLPTSANAESSLEPVYALDVSSGKIGDSTKFGTSQLVGDLMSKGESWTYTSSVPSNSNAFTDSKRGEIVRTTVAPGNKYFGTRQSIASTESHLSTDYLKIPTDTVVKKSKINNSVTQNFKSNQDSMVFQKQNVPPSDEVEDLWLDIFQPGRNREPKKWNKQVMRSCFLRKVFRKKST